MQPRRSSRKTKQVSYAELAGYGEELPEASSSKKKGKRKAADDSDIEHEDEQQELSNQYDHVDSDTIMAVPLDGLEPPGVEAPEKPSISELETKRVQRLATITSSHIRKNARESNARARPCPVYFPDPVVRLTPGYGITHGLFTAQSLTEEGVKRTSVSTRKERDKIGMNVGAGPVLDMCEDLGWFREAKPGSTEKRPLVYQDVHIGATDCVMLQPSEAISYIYSGRPQGLDTVGCLMGPLGDQKLAKVKLFETQKLDEFWPTNQALVFNAGNPVWGLDWCPVSEGFTAGKPKINMRSLYSRLDISSLAEHKYAQYLAVSTIPPTETLSEPPTSLGDLPPLIPKARAYKSSIQIWRFGPSKIPTNSADLGIASCVLVICLDDVPPARLLRWCPLPTHDEVMTNNGRLRKLGILAGVFGDGSVAVYAIPEPESLGTGGSEPAYVQLTRPLVCITLPDARFTYLDWANSEVVALGCSNGHVAVYNLKSAIQGKENPQGLPLLPTHYVSIHQSRVRSVRWVRIPEEPEDINAGSNEGPYMLVSGGFDGHVYLLDIRYPEGMPLQAHHSMRIDIIQSIAFSAYGGGIISNEHENMVKFTGLHPLVFGRGHNITEAQGPIWDIAASDLHPQTAVASSDGTLTISNLLKYVRKGSSMPSFIHTVYRMDYNRRTNELRMVDMLTPRVSRHLNKTRKMPQGAAPPDAATTQQTAVERERDGFGTWEPKIGIHCAAWQPTRLAQAGVLASGGASGLVRIDVLREYIFKPKPQDGTLLEAGEDEDEDEPGDD